MRPSRLPRRSVALAAVASSVHFSAPALAAPNDGAALKLRDQAIYSDYLATNFAAAESKLAEAIASCNDADSCSPSVRARLQCDLASVLFGDGKADEAKAHFILAHKQDPGVALEKDLSSPDLRRLFDSTVSDTAIPSTLAARPPAADEDATHATPLDRATPQTDCPPGFPGCGEGAPRVACESDADCASAQACRDGTCGDTGAPPAESAPFQRNWLSIAFQTDLLFLPSADDACGGGTGYTCFGSGGDYYGAIPLKGADDAINGGPVPSTVRILVGYDRALVPNVTVGARLGYAFNGGPQRPSGSAFDPLHVEARGSYWFGHDPLARSGFRFYAVVAGGMAQVDGSVPVDVYASAQAYKAGQSQDYVAWKKTGLAFGAAGGGAMYALTPSTGVILEAKFMELFPTAAPAAGLQLAYAVGL